jgi:plastocyanin
MTRVLTLAALASLVVAVVAGNGAAAPPKLVGTVGPGFTIKLTKGGAKVKTLPAGTYTVVVNDKSSIHSFVMEGNHWEKELTSVPFTGTKSVVVKLKKGKYKYYCKPHESSMFGFVTVT